MKNSWSIMVLCALAAACVACNDDTSGDGLSGAASDSYFAVVSTNYSGATAISLLGKDGEVVASSWVSSKTKNPDLRTPLADDVALPTTSYSRHYLTTLERGIGVVTRFDLTNGKVLGQLRTDDSPAGTKADDMSAYHSNPQDVFYVSDSSAWVSRMAPNPNPKATTREKGSDLIEFDPATMKRSSRRIDLSSLDTTLEETQYDKNFKPIGMLKNPAAAQPQGLVPAGKFLVVGLVRATAAFNYAPGMVAVVDPVAGKLVDSLELGKLTNCGEVRPVLGEASQALVACIGTWGDGGAAAGLVRIAVDEKGKASIVHAYHVADHKGAADTNSYIVSLGGDLVVAIAPGTKDPKNNDVVITPDVAYSVDLKTGKQKQLWKSDGAYSLGVPAVDKDTGALLIPDAGSAKKPLYGVHRFLIDPDTHAISDDAFVSVAAKTTLGAHEAHAL